MTFTTAAQRELLHDNYHSENWGERVPVVKLFTPDANATWLLTTLDPENDDIAWGLCDLGVGFPELGYVSLKELSDVRGSLGLPVERDLHVRFEKSTNAYCQLAQSKGFIVV